MSDTEKRRQVNYRYKIFISKKQIKYYKPRKNDRWSERWSIQKIVLNLKIWKYFDANNDSKWIGIYNPSKKMLAFLLQMNQRHQANTVVNSSTTQKRKIRRNCTRGASYFLISSNSITVRNMSIQIIFNRPGVTLHSLYQI